MYGKLIRKVLFSKSLLVLIVYMDNLQIYQLSKPTGFVTCPSKNTDFKWFSHLITISLNDNAQSKRWELQQKDGKQTVLHIIRTFKIPKDFARWGKFYNVVEFHRGGSAINGSNWLSLYSYSFCQTCPIGGLKGPEKKKHFCTVWDSFS